jgi:rhodanese-related sulfurtransferase
MRMSRDDVIQLLERDSGVLLLNVLPHENYDGGHIPGSLSVPLEDGDFVAEVDGLCDGDRTVTIVTYCASEACPLSTRAMERLQAAGFTDVRDYKGGMDDWQGAAMPVESGVSAG